MPDIEQLIVAPLRAQFPSSRVATETPANLETLPSAIQPIRAGGPSDRTMDHARLVIHTFGTKSGETSAREVARSLAYDVRDWMVKTFRRSSLADGSAVTLVVCDSGPMFVPDQNTNVRHFVATYTVHLR